MSQNNTSNLCQSKAERLYEHRLQILPLNYSGAQLELEECKIRVVKNTEMTKKPVSLWAVDDVCEWIRSHFPGHSSGFVEAICGHAVSGRALLRMTEGKLKQMGIDENHRHSLLQEILQLRIQDDVDSLTSIFEGISKSGF